MQLLYTCTLLWSLEWAHNQEWIAGWIGEGHPNPSRGLGHHTSQDLSRVPYSNKPRIKYHIAYFTSSLGANVAAWLFNVFLSHALSVQVWI